MAESLRKYIDLRELQDDDVWKKPKYCEVFPKMQGDEKSDRVSYLINWKKRDSAFMIEDVIDCFISYLIPEDFHDKKEVTISQWRELKAIVGQIVNSKHGIYDANELVRLKYEFKMLGLVSLAYSSKAHMQCVRQVSAKHVQDVIDALAGQKKMQPEWIVGVPSSLVKIFLESCNSFSCFPTFYPTETSFPASECYTLKVIDRKPDCNAGEPVNLEVEFCRRVTTMIYKKIGMPRNMGGYQKMFQFLKTVKIVEFMVQKVPFASFVIGVPDHKKRETMEYKIYINWAHIFAIGGINIHLGRAFLIAILVRHLSQIFYLKKLADGKEAECSKYVAVHDFGLECEVMATHGHIDWWQLFCSQERGQEIEKKIQKIDQAEQIVSTFATCAPGTFKNKFLMRDVAAFKEYPKEDPTAGLFGVCFLPVIKVGVGKEQPLSKEEEEFRDRLLNKEERKRTMEEEAELEELVARIDWN